MNIRRFGLAGGWVLAAAWLLGGCQMFSDSFETAAQLDQKNQGDQALKAYQTYLKNHPQSVLAPRIYLRIAALNQANSQYEAALDWYTKVHSEFPGTDEDLHSLLNIADLYRNNLKDQAKAVDFSKKAFDLYLNYNQIHDAVQTVIVSQLGAATTLFYQKKYLEAGEMLRNLLESYPSSLVLPETRAKVEALQDRVRREELIAGCDATALKLRSETPFNNSFMADFPASPSQLEAGLLSPDGHLLVSRKKAPNGVVYLYLAKVSPNSNEVSFRLLPQTFGAEVPTWSSDSDSLVYERKVGKLRKLEKTSLSKKTTHTLFYAPDTRVPLLGLHPAFHPSGNKIAFVYDGKLWCMNADGLNKSLLKTTQKFDYTSELSWSFDGTMIRGKQGGTNPADDLLILDETPSVP